MNQLESALLNIIGRYPTYMRPPYLSCDGTCLSTLNTLGYHVMSTNLDTLDWLYNTPSTNSESQRIFDNAISSTTSGGWLVLAHSVHETTVSLLAQHMIDSARARGYRRKYRSQAWGSARMLIRYMITTIVVTVGECMGDPPANWYRTAL